MNKKQLAKLGVPENCMDQTMTLMQSLIQAGMRGKAAKTQILAVLEDPESYLETQPYAVLAQALCEQEEVAEELTAKQYKTWGEEFIDQASHKQMMQACSLPNAVGGALMPDAHLGYGLPIGGVLALENAVCPYAVGVDIACRMKLSVLDLPVESFKKESRVDQLQKALEDGTVFGTGKSWDRKQEHPVMDQDWRVTKITRQSRDKAWNQLGTSGSGNHFVEFGLLTLKQDDLGLPAGEYVALMSHSGSRGTGHAVCSTYSAIARKNLPRKYEQVGVLAWLDLDTEAGQEYWAAMNLMGDYAAANHDVIHRNVSRLSGAKVLTSIENHHNFAWKEIHNGKEVVVHRKGATPAGEGVLGVIPGSMATPAYVVRGLGNASSYASASHGAGRMMSRTKAREQYRINAVKGDLAAKGIRVVSAGSDEVPMAYKSIEDVMNAQVDLVERVAQFDPKVVKMCGDGSRPED